MKVYAMSDIHGCLGAFEKALSLVAPHLEAQDSQLVLLGDYLHGGSNNYEILDRIMKLQSQYGSDKVIALMGNHEEFVLLDDSTIENMIKNADYDSDEAIKAEKYIRWIKNLPRYYIAGNTIFVHAGIDEDAGDLWEWCTAEEIFVGKYPAETGQIPNLDMKIVAGHVGTAEISGDSYFHDIFYDGASHFYIDGTVLVSGVIPVLMVDTETDKYYRVTEGGNWLILPYDEEN